MKRQIALLCALLLLFSFAVSCGKTEAEPQDAEITTLASDATAATAQTTPAETEPPKAFDTVPDDVNLDGYVFNILYTSFLGIQNIEILQSDTLEKILKLVT